MLWRWLIYSSIDKGLVIVVVDILIIAIVVITDVVVTIVVGFWL
jgi:hypothetical protein